MEWKVSSEAEMIDVAKEIAPLLKSRDVVALYGTLGVGKTTFVRALISVLKDAQVDVPSPTFTLVQLYDTSLGPVYHFDCYRLKSPEEAFEIGIDDAFVDGISLIEWPDKLGNLLPKKHKSLLFDLQSDGTRKITTEGF